MATVDVATPGVARATATAEVRVATLVRVLLVVVLCGNLVRLPALTEGERQAPVSPLDLAVLTTLVGAAFASLRARRLLIDRVALLGIVFACVGGASAVLAAMRYGLTGGEVAMSLAYLARWSVYFAVYVAVFNGVGRDAVPDVLRTFEGAAAAFAAFGIFQSAFLPGFAQIVYPESIPYIDWDPQGRRLVSTILDPNFAGAFVMLALVVAVARLTVGERVSGWRLAVLATAILLTASRSTILSTLIAIAVLVGYTGLSRRVARRGLVVLGALVLASPLLVMFAAQYNKLRIDASALERLVSWERAWRMFADHPVLGVGFNTFGFVQRAYGGSSGRSSFNFSLDGGLIFIAVMTGLVGLALYLGMIDGMRRHAKRLRSAAEPSTSMRALGAAVPALTTGLIVHSLFVNSLLLPFLMAPLWVLWGLVGSAAREQPDAPAS